MKKILLVFFLLSFGTAYSSSDFIDKQNEIITSFYVYPVSLNKTRGEATNAEIIREEERKAAGNAAAGGVIAGAVVGGVVAGVPGAVVGGTAGGVISAHCCKSEYKDIDWIESSCLDLVFHTKRGDTVVYDLMIRLRPVPPGWRKSTNDEKKPFKSKVQIFWVEHSSYSTIFLKDRLEALKDSLSLPQPSGCCSFSLCTSHSGLEYSTQHRSSDERELEQDSVFEGNLSRAFSIGEILRVVDQMRVNGKFPACSWSGKSKKCCRREKDVLNPVIFTYTLLHKLNAFGSISENQLRTSFLGEAPVTRVQAVQNLRTRVPGGIKINEPKIEELIENSRNRI